jgi:hypothetical protein
MLFWNQSAHYNKRETKVDAGHCDAEHAGKAKKNSDYIR